MHRNFSSICLCNVIYIFHIHLPLISHSCFKFFLRNSSFRISSPVSSNMLTYEDDRWHSHTISFKWERIVDLDSFIIYSTKRDWLYYISCWNWITIRRVIFKESITRGNYIGADWELDRKLSSFDPLESSVTAIEGNPAYKIEFTATDDKQEKTQSNANIDSKRRESIFIYV